MLKRTLFAFFMTLVLSLGFVGNANSITGFFPYAPWTASTPSQLIKVQEFMTYALAQPTTGADAYGGQCIVWVQNLMTRASGNYIVGSRQFLGTNDYTVLSPGSVLVRKANQSYTQFAYGDIVQMHFYNQTKAGNYPHTAIIVGSGKDSAGNAGFWWIDSNFVAANTVGQHFISNATFYASVVRYTGVNNGYNVYTIK